MSPRPAAAVVIMLLKLANTIELAAIELDWISLYSFFTLSSISIGELRYVCVTTTVLPKLDAPNSEIAAEKMD